jgi:CRP-like cAMP-binding protein
MKAIAKDPAERYKSWLDFGKEVTRAFMSLRIDTTTPAPTSDSEKFGKIRDLPFFRDFGEVELWEVVRVATWQMIDSGTVLMRENEQGDSFYVLVDGEVEVSLLGKPLAVLKPGGCFGEILYFADSVERRTTTVTARGRITVVQIKAGALRIATPSCQVGFNKAFMRVLVERLAQANRQLAQR